MPNSDRPINLEKALGTSTTIVRKAGELLLAELHRPDGPRGGPDKCPADTKVEVLLKNHLTACSHSS